MSCNSSSKQIQKEWKKANAVLTLKFKEYTDINETLVSKIVDMRNDAILNKSALLQLLQDYLSNLQECCASLGSKIDDTIYYFENMPCLCPPTTTTTEAPIFTTTGTEPPTPTTTPTPDECNTPTYVDEKGSFYPYIVTKYLGTDLGLVTLTFNTYDIPDRIVVEWDSNDVIDTGYHGLVKFQAKLNAAVAVYGDVAGAINPAQTGTISFIKDNANEWAIVKVYAPLNNTRFEFTLSCPEPYTTTTTEVTTTTTTNCFNWILTDTADDGNWTYFDILHCDGSSEIIGLRNGEVRVVCLAEAVVWNPLRGTAVNTNDPCNTTTTTTEELVTTTTEEGTTTTTFPCDLEVEVIDPIPVTTTTTTAEPVTTTTEEPVTTTTEDFVTTTTAEPCLFPPDYDVPATLFMSVVSPPLGIFSGSLVNACNALYGFNNLGYTIAPGYYAVSKRHGFNDYWRIGDFVFDTEECSLVPSGYYIVQVPGQDYRVIYIVDGEIIGYPECTTTTTEATTTTTCEECDTEKYSLIISVMNNTIQVDFTDLDVAESIDAWCTWVSEELVIQYGYGLQGSVCGTIEVGQILYIDDKCTLLPTGSYIYDPNFVVNTETLHTHFNVDVLEIVDGEIMSITPTDCEPETTTTTTAEMIPIFSFDVVNSQSVDGSFTADSGKSIRIEWGDATNYTFTGQYNFTKDYGSSGNRTVTLYAYDETDLTKISLQGFGGDEKVSFSLSSVPSAVTDITAYGFCNVIGDLSDLPPSIVNFEITGGNITGNISDIPNTVLLFNIESHSGNISGDIANLPPNIELFGIEAGTTISGNISNFPSSLLYINVQGSNTITGDLADLPSGVTSVYLQGDNTINTYTQGRVWAADMDTVGVIQANGYGLSSSEVDNLLIDLADTTWSPGTISLYPPNECRTSASDTAYSTIEGYGVSISVNECTTTTTTTP